MADPRLIAFQRHLAVSRGVVLDRPKFRSPAHAKVVQKSQAALSDYGRLGAPLEYVEAKRGLDASQAFMRVESEGAVRAQPEYVLARSGAPSEAAFRSSSEASEGALQGAPGASVADYDSDPYGMDTGEEEAYAEWGNQDKDEPSDHDDGWPQTMEGMRDDTPTTTANGAMVVSAPQGSTQGVEIPSGATGAPGRRKGQYRPGHWKKLAVFAVAGAAGFWLAYKAFGKKG